MELGKEYKVLETKMVDEFKPKEEGNCISFGTLTMELRTAIKRCKTGYIIDIAKEPYVVVAEDKDLSSYQTTSIMKEVFNLNGACDSFLFKSKLNHILYNNDNYYCFFLMDDDENYRLYQLPYLIYKDFIKDNQE